MVKVRKIRLVNPRRKSRRRNGARKRRHNPLATLGYINPSKGTSKMKTRKKRRHNPFGKRRRRNPSPVVTRGISVVKMGVSALGGLFAARQLPNMVLGARNTGFFGYLANAVVTIGGSALISRYAGKEAGQAFFVGGSLYTVQRVLDDQTSLGRALRLQGVGDARAAALAGIGPAPGVRQTVCLPPAAAAVPMQMSGIQAARPSRLAGRF